jgi:hypothetical protein
MSDKAMMEREREMVKTREKRSEQVDELNYIPLLVEHFGAAHTARLLGFLALWGASGCPKLPDLARRNVYGLSKSAVYKYFVQLREWAVWCRDEKGMANIAPDIDHALAMARLGLRALAASTEKSVGVDNNPAVLLLSERQR